MAESKTAGEGSSDNHEDWPEVELTWGTQMKKKKKWNENDLKPTLYKEMMEKIYCWDWSMSKFTTAKILVL